jgi:hypothetical protein
MRAVKQGMKATIAGFDATGVSWLAEIDIEHDDVRLTA